MPVITRPIYRHIPLVDSTHRMLADQMRSVQDFNVLRADEQFAGRGSGDHQWFSPKGGLYFSASFPVRKDLIDSRDLAYYIAERTLVALRNVRILDYDTAIKPPNDLYRNGLKFGGTLVELVPNTNWIVASCGLNITNWYATAAELRDAGYSAVVERDRDPGKLATYLAWQWYIELGDY